MKVKKTLKGNVKVTLNPEQAERLKNILIRSHFIGIKDKDEADKAFRSESLSVALCHAFTGIGVVVPEHLE